MSFASLHLRQSGTLYPKQSVDKGGDPTYSSSSAIRVRLDSRTALVHNRDRTEQRTFYTAEVASEQAIAVGDRLVVSGTNFEVVEVIPHVDVSGTTLLATLTLEERA